jgi:DNA-binding response OmpR family regulator
MDTILVVEDDCRAQKALRRLFEYEGYKVEVCCDGQSAVERVRTAAPTAVILDLDLPALSGKRVCCEIRRTTISLPIIVLSALKSESDKILMLELGADDYVTKPFSHRELLARVRAAIRRTPVYKSANPQKVEFGSACVDFITMEATFAGRPIELTGREFRLLRFLVNNEDHVVCRGEIPRKIYRNNISPRTRTIDNLISKLRQKLEPDPANPTHILTVRCVGYRFVR